MTITIPTEKGTILLSKGMSLIRSLVTYLVADVRSKPLRFASALLIGGVIGFFIGPRAGVLWFLFVLFLAYEWDSRAIGVCALLCLAICPILLRLHQDTRAEQVAAYAYFFLVMTVALQLVEYKRHPARFVEGEEKERV